MTPFTTESLKKALLDKLMIHFGKTAETLSRRDCALIAATLPNPRRFSSKEPSKYMRKRQRQILKEMKFVKWKDTK